MTQQQRTRGPRQGRCTVPRPRRFGHAARASSEGSSLAPCTPRTWRCLFREITVLAPLPSPPCARLRGLSVPGVPRSRPGRAGPLCARGGPGEGDRPLGGTSSPAPPVPVLLVHLADGV